MNDDPIATLLEEDVWERRRSPHRLIVAGLLTLAMKAAVLWLLLESRGDEATEQNAAANSTALITTTSARSR